MTIEQRVKYEAHRTAHSRWFNAASRVGFLAKGAIYAIIGVFALRLVLGNGGALLGSHEATRTVALQPFGQVLLALLGVGLACHALWNVLRSIVERGDGSAVQIAKRIGWAASGVMHGALAVGAFETLIGMRQGRRVWLQRFLQWEGGRWVMIALGLIVIGVGLYQLYQAYTAKFREELDTARMSPTERTWALRVGRLGLAARGVVMPLVGWFFIQAGLHASASRAQGIGAALRQIANQTWGTILVALVAAGFVAYAAYMGVTARYRRAIA